MGHCYGSARNWASDCVLIDQRREVKVRSPSRFRDDSASLSREETAITAAWTDLKAHAASTPRAMAHVRRTARIRVNASIDSAAGEMHAQESPAGRGTISASGRWRACQVELPVWGHGRAGEGVHYNSGGRWQPWEDRSASALVEPQFVPLGRNIPTVGRNEPGLPSLA